MGPWHHGFLWRTRHHLIILICLRRSFFDKTVFVKFKISNSFERNIDETDLTELKILWKIHTSIWISNYLEKSGNQKSRGFAKS
jgi:hypothetical protein